MHSVGVAERHGSGRIPMIPAFQSHQLATFGMTKGMLVLHRHLGGTFYGNAARIRIENPVQAFGKEFYKVLAKFNSRFVGEPAEHHVAHFFALLLDCLNNFRSIVSVRHAPPARHGVYKFQPIGCFNGRAVSFLC